MGITDEDDTKKSQSGPKLSEALWGGETEQRQSLWAALKLGLQCLHRYRALQIFYFFSGSFGYFVSL